MRAVSLVILFGLSFSSCSFSGASAWLVDSALASWSPASAQRALGSPGVRCGFEIDPRDEAPSDAQSAFLKCAGGLWRNNLDGVVMELDRDGHSSMSQDGVAIDANSLEFNLESISVGSRGSGESDHFEILSHKTLSPGRIVYVSREDRQGFRFLLIQTGTSGLLEAPGNCVAYELKIGAQDDGEPAVFLRGPIQSPLATRSLAVRDPSQFASQLFTR